MESKEKKSAVKLYTLIILLLLYVAVISFPLSLIPNEYGSKAVGITLKVIFLIVAFISIKKYGVSELRFLPVKEKKQFLLLPLLVMTFSNWIYVWIFKAPLKSSVDGGMLTFTIFVTLLTVFCEELLFREIMHDCLKDYIKQDYLRILISATLFSLLHFLNVFNGMDIYSVLAQVGYTFVLGLVLGLIKEKGAGLIALISFHFLFNVLNNDLFSVLYNGEWNTEFIVTNIIIGVVVIAYGVLMYFLLKVDPLLFNSKDNNENEVSNSTHK